MLWNRNKLFCDINPTCYKISLQKEIVKRHVQNMLSKEKFAGKISNEKLPNLVSEHHSHLIKEEKELIRFCRKIKQMIREQEGVRKAAGIFSRFRVQ